MLSILLVLGLSGCASQKGDYALQTQAVPVQKSGARKLASSPLHTISYLRNLPVTVRHATPHGALSCFWGTFRLGEKGSSYALHLFKADPNQGIRGEDYQKRQHFTLDVFQVSNSSTYHRINRRPFNFWSNTWGATQFGVAWFWANAHNTKVPVFQFDIWATDGEYGTVGDNVYAAFPQGLKREIILHNLSFGTWRASDTLGEGNVVERAPDGLAQISVGLYPEDDYINPTDYQFTLKWDGRRFVPTKPLNDLTRTYASAM